MCLHCGVEFHGLLQRSYSCICLCRICLNPPLDCGLGSALVQTLRLAFKNMVPPILLLHITQTCSDLCAVTGSVWSDLVVTSAVSVEDCIYCVENAHCHVKYQSNHIPMILIQPQLLLLLSSLNVPENNIIKIDRICFIHIEEEAIYRKGRDEVSTPKEKE